MNSQASSSESDKQKSPFKAFVRNGQWFFQLAEGALFGPFDQVYEAILGEKKSEERELDRNEAFQLLLQFV